MDELVDIEDALEDGVVAQLRDWWVGQKVHEELLLTMPSASKHYQPDLLLLLLVGRKGPDGRVEG